MLAFKDVEHRKPNYLQQEPHIQIPRNIPTSSKKITNEQRKPYDSERKDRLPMHNRTFRV